MQLYNGQTPGERAGACGSIANEMFGSAPDSVMVPPSY